MVMIVSGISAGSLCFTPLLQTEFMAYWKPQRIGGGYIGIEDFVFLFQFGASTWFLAQAPFQGNLRCELQPGRVIAGAGVFVSIGALLLVGLQRLGFNFTTASLLAPVAFIFLLLLWQRHLWRIALAASLGQTALYALLIKFCSWLWPGFLAQWDLHWRADVVTASTIGGIPALELAWALVFAPAHAMIIAYLVHIKWRRHRL